MPSHVKKAKRDIQKGYSLNQFTEKLRRLADCLEQGKSFRIQINGERITVPGIAEVTIEHERGKCEEEIEFQIKWLVGK